jgi:hypothetical protein
MLPNRDSMKGWARGIGLFSMIVGDLLGFPLAGAAIGYGLWKKAGAPWGVVPVCGVAGVALAFYRLYQISKKDWNA